MFVFLSFAHFQGDYDVIDAETNMSVLFTLLRDWVRSVKGGFISPERRNEFLLLVEREEDEKLYQKVLELPLAVSSTILYVVRFIWQLMLFPKSVNRNPDSSVCFYSSLYPTSIVADALGNSSQLGAMFIVLLRAVAVHEREPFLPPDPMESEIDQFKVLLFSRAWLASAALPTPHRAIPSTTLISLMGTESDSVSSPTFENQSRSKDGERCKTRIRCDQELRICRVNTPPRSRTRATLSPSEYTL